MPDTEPQWADSGYRMRKTAYEIRCEADDPANRFTAEFKAGMKWASIIIDARSDDPDEFWRTGNV